MIETYFTQTTIHIHLISILSSFNLHLPFDVFPKFENILFLSHELICEHGTPWGRFIVFHHVYLYKVNSLLRRCTISIFGDLFRLDHIQVLLYSIKGRFRMIFRLWFFERFRCDTLLLLVLRFFNILLKVFSRDVRSLITGQDTQSVTLFICVQKFALFFNFGLGFLGTWLSKLFGSLLSRLINNWSLFIRVV